MARKKQSPNVGIVRNPEEEIRRRAYELYEARGRAHGHAVDDWLQAEQEIKTRRIHVAA